MLARDNKVLPFPIKIKKARPKTTQSFENKIADKVALMKMKIKDMQAECMLLESELLNHFDRVVNGDVNSVDFVGDEWKCKVTRKDQYGKMKTEYSQPLFEILGGRIYNSIIKPKTEIKIKENCDIEEFRSLLADKGVDVSDFLIIDKSLTLKKDFLKTYSRLERTATNIQKNTMDELKTTLQYKPSITCKRRK